VESWKPPEPFAVHRSENGEAVRLRLVGELDLASAPGFRDTLFEDLRAGRAVVVDLSELVFIDSQGLRVLLMATEESGANGWELWVRDAFTPIVRRGLELSGVLGLLRTVDE
jgi:anti-anti-sigma factor